MIEKIKKIINSSRFYLYIGKRYLKSRKQNGKINIIFISLFAGISLGLMVLIVVLGIMNGFQENHISRRIEIGSFHVTISKKEFNTFTLPEAEKFKLMLYNDFNEIEAVVPFSDREAILKINKKEFSEDQIIKLRAVDPDEIKKDSRFNKYFKINYGKFDLGENSIILGEALAYKILAKIGGQVFLTPDISLSSIRNSGIPFSANGFFYTESYDYDRYWGFISTKSLESLAGKAEIDGIGLKFKNKNHEAKVIKKLKVKFGNEFLIQTAEEINSGFFSALKLEKAMIIFLFGLIFFMVAANTFGALKLTIIEKKKDISILKAIGSKPEDIRIIFLMESFVIGFAGSLTGIILGFFVAYNVANIFLVVEFVINSILGFISYLLEYAVPGFYFVPVKIYDTSIYYQTSFVIKIDFIEIVLISFFIIAMTVFAAYIPVSKASKLKPNEVIRN
jgi:lipoprotein-releasing system permease protein